MNYIKELNAFQQWLLVNQLPTGAIALWRTLLSLNNTAGWKKRFTGPNSTVEQLTGLSRQGLDDSRKLLVKHGLIIVWEKGRYGKAPVYEMVAFCQESDVQLDQLLDKPLGENLTILKEKQNKREEENPFHLYEENFGILKPILRDSLIAWCEDLGDELVIAAIRLATRKGGRSFSYLETILKEWAGEGLKTVEQVQSYENRKEKNKVNTVPFQKQKRNQKKVLFDELRRESGS